MKDQDFSKEDFLKETINLLQNIFYRRFIVFSVTVTAFYITPFLISSDIHAAPVRNAWTLKLSCKNYFNNLNVMSSLQPADIFSLQTLAQAYVRADAMLEGHDVKAEIERGFLEFVKRMRSAGAPQEIGLSLKSILLDFIVKEKEKNDPDAAKFREGQLQNKVQLQDQRRIHGLQKIFLKYGAKDFYSALQVIISLADPQNQNIELAEVKFLLEFGVDLNKVSYRDHTLLMAASRRGNAAIVQLLLDHGAQINNVHLNHTALSFAATSEVFHLLYQSGAKVRTTPEAVVKILSRASREGWKDVLEVLAHENVDLSLMHESLQERNMTALIWATKSKHLDTVQYLLSQNVRYDDQNVFGQTALMFSVMNNGSGLEITRSLLNAGANIHKKSRADKTALDYALQYGNTAAAELIRAKDAQERSTPFKYFFRRLFP